MSAAIGTHVAEFCTGCRDGVAGILKCGHHPDAYACADRFSAITSYRQATRQHLLFP